MFRQVTVFLPCEEMDAEQVPAKKEAVADKSVKPVSWLLATTLLRDGACHYKAGETQSGPTLTGVLSPHAEHAPEPTSAHRVKMKNESPLVSKTRYLFYFQHDRNGG
jgi:hypothetical protein